MTRIGETTHFRLRVQAALLINGSAPEEGWPHTISVDISLVLIRWQRHDKHCQSTIPTLSSRANQFASCIVPHRVGFSYSLRPRGVLRSS